MAYSVPPDDVLVPWKPAVRQILDAFGNVAMLRIQRNGDAIDKATDERLRSLVGEWSFPFVKTMAACAGKCSAIFAIGDWLTHYSEMIPVPAE